MRPSPRVLPALVLAALASVLDSGRAGAQTTAPAPTPTKPGTAATTPAAATASASPDRAGVVQVEQAGRVLGLGIVLNDDGRIVTSFSRVKSNNQGPLFVRYADGTYLQARIGHSDQPRDLALLVPKTLRVRRGIQASRSATTPVDTTLIGFANGKNRSVPDTHYTVKSLARSGGRSVLELTPTPKLTDLGSPLLDTKGQAVAIVVGGCLPNTAPTSASPAAPTPPTAPTAPTAPAAPSPEASAPRTLLPAPAAPCVFTPVGISVAEIRNFLRALPPEAAPTLPWLGIDGISADTGLVRGIRVGRVEPNSPAAALPLQISTEAVPGDILVAVGGTPVPTLDSLSVALSSRAAGERVDLLVYGKDGYRTHPVRLAERPATPSAAREP